MNAEFFLKNFEKKCSIFFLFVVFYKLFRFLVMLFLNLFGFVHFVTTGVVQISISKPSRTFQFNVNVLIRLNLQLFAILI